MKKYLTILALILTYITYAQDAPTVPTTLFSGSADAYYKYDFSNAENSFTSFTNSHNSFELGMISIKASHKMDKASFFVDLGFGNRVSQFTYNDTKNTFMIKQLNFTYEFSKDFKITAGSFATHLGYELVDAVDNKNYSISYAFTYGPFFNTGIKAQYTSGKFNFMAGVTNPTDFKSAIDAKSKQKTFIGQLSYISSTGSVYFNVTSGSSNPSSDENKTQFDFVGSKKINDKFSLGLNATYALAKNDTDNNLDGNWFALVGYTNYTIKETLGLAYRIEYFDAKKATPALANLAGSSIVGNTISLNYKVGHLTIIPEVRIDCASEDIFEDSHTTPKRATVFALWATTYTF